MTGTLFTSRTPNSLRVVVADAETGEILSTVVVSNDFMVITHGVYSVGSSQHWLNGTHQFTINRHRATAKEAADAPADQ